MARKKLERFTQNKSFKHVIEPQREEVLNGFKLQGKWGREIFGNDHPIVLEIGCGKGEYTVAMAREFPEKNFIGIDIKGARIWYGAREVADENLKNAAFLRTQAELLDRCFAAGEVSEIWITFPDPQIKYKRAKHRLTHPAMLETYRRFLQKKGLIHLKTDSEFLHGYTLGLLEILQYRVLESWHDIDHQIYDRDSLLHRITTHYERLFREKGKAITYLKFQLHE